MNDQNPPDRSGDRIELPVTRRGILTAGAAGFATPILSGIGAGETESTQSESIEDILEDFPEPDRSLLDNLDTSRPRVLVTSEDFNRVQSLHGTSEDIDRWISGTQVLAESWLGNPTDWLTDPPINQLRSSRKSFSNIRVLAFLYHVTGEEQYASYAREILLTAAGLPSWNPGHFLDVGEMTTAVAVGYDWLHDYLSNDDLTTIRNAIVENGIREGLIAWRDDASWTGRETNWNIVCNGGLAIGALALAGDSEAPTEVVTTVLTEARNRADKFFSRYGPNGGWFEGMNYWVYATRYGVHYLSTSINTLGTHYGYLGDEYGFGNAGKFAVHMTGPVMPFNFGDGTESVMNFPWVFWLSQQQDRPLWTQQQLDSAQQAEIEEPGQHRIEADLHALRFRPELLGDTNDPPLHAHFPGGQESGTLRNSWDDDATFVGFKGGAYRSHGDLDFGTFVLDAVGERWAIDYGGARRNHGYWDDGPNGRRWDHWQKRMEGHNTIVVNPGEGTNAGVAINDPNDFDAPTNQIERIESNDTAGYGIVDLGTAHPELDQAKRGFALLDDGKQVLIQDDLKSPEPMELWWFMHTRETDVTVDGNTASFTKNGKQLHAKIL